MHRKILSCGSNSRFSCSHRSPQTLVLACTHLGMDLLNLSLSFSLSLSLSLNTHTHTHTHHQPINAASSTQHYVAARPSSTSRAASPPPTPPSRWPSTPRRARFPLFRSLAAVLLTSTLLPFGLRQRLCSRTLLTLKHGRVLPMFSLLLVSSWLGRQVGLLLLSGLL